MPEKQDKIFPEGLFFELPPANAPDFVKGRLSIKVYDFMKFAEEYQNAGGYININLKVSKNGGKGYAELNTWKPSDKPSTDKPQEVHVASDVEYPEEDNGEVPF